VSIALNPGVEGSLPVPIREAVATDTRQTNDTIDRVDVWRVACPVADRSAVAGTTARDPLNAASPDRRQVEALILRVRTRDGLEGWGEAFGHSANPSSLAALHSMVIPFAQGRSTDPYAFAADASKAFHPFGRGGPIAYAASGVEIALWDIAAQRAGVPLRELLAPGSGGRVNHVEAYASLPSYQGNAPSLVEAVARVVERGFDHVKLHETRSETILAVREAFPELHVATDMNAWWGSEDEDALRGELRDAGLWFVEEPLFPPSDVEALRRLRQAGIATAAGENAGDVADLLTMMRAGALSIAQPSVAKIGGVGSVARIHAEAARLGPGEVDVMPHCYYIGPAFYAVAQIVAAFPSPTAYVEAPIFDWQDVLHPAQDAAASIALPDAPGLGFPVDLPRLTELTLHTNGID